MQVSNYSEFRKHLKAHLDHVTENKEPLVVHRQNGKTVVVISLDDYNAWEETAYLVASPANKKRLDDSIAQLKAGKVNEYKLSGE